MSARGLQQRADDGLDHCRAVASIPRPVQAGDDDAGGVVGLHAAVQQMQRLADDAGIDHVFHRDALLVIGLRVVGGMLGMRAFTWATCSGVVP